jgi:hypothetical protein
MDDNSTQDIQQVADDEELFRRLTVRNQLAKNTDGTYRPSSAVYRSTLGDISVDIASKTTPEESIKDAIALIGIFAKEPKELGYPVVEDPIEENLDSGIEENQAHALIKVEGKMTQSHARRLVRVSSWVIQPR